MMRKIRQAEHGQAIVEMALVLPIFLLLLFGVIEMGQVGYAYITVANAARSGGRIAAVGGSDSDINTAVLNGAPALNPASLQVTIDPSQAQRQSGESVSVQVSYPVQLIIPVISNLIPNPIVVNSRIVMRVE